MNNRLSIKLFMPIFTFGIIFLLALLFAPESLSKYSVLAIIFVLVLLQVTASYTSLIKFVIMLCVGKKIRARCSIEQ